MARGGVSTERCSIRNSIPQPPPRIVPFKWNRHGRRLPSDYVRPQANRILAPEFSCKGFMRHPKSLQHTFAIMLVPSLWRSETCRSPSTQLNSDRAAQVVYGIKVLPKGDPYIKAAEEALAAIKEAGNPGTFLVDILPICAYLRVTFIVCQSVSLCNSKVRSRVDAGGWLSKESPCMAEANHRSLCCAFHRCKGRPCKSFQSD